MVCSNVSTSFGQPMIAARPTNLRARRGSPCRHSRASSHESASTTSLHPSCPRNPQDIRRSMRRRMRHEPSHALVIHEILVTASVPVRLFARSLGIIAEGKIPPYLFRKLGSVSDLSSGSEVWFGYWLEIWVQHPRSEIELVCRDRSVSPGGASKRDQLSPSGRFAHPRNQRPPTASLGTSRADSSTRALYVSGSRPTAHAALVARGRSAGRVDPRLHPGHESGCRHEQPAARGARGAHGHASCLPPSRRHGRSHPPPTALRLRAHGRAAARCRRRRLRCAASACPTRAACRSAFRPQFRPRRPARRIAPSPSTRRFCPSTRSTRRPASTWARSTSICASSAAPRSFTAAPPWPIPDTCWPTSISATCSTSWSASTNPSPPTCKAVTLSPRYADAHYNLALAYERTGEPRNALRHWRAYVKLDNHGPWADHARGQIRKLLGREGITIVARADHFIAPRKGRAALALV